MFNWGIAKTLNTLFVKESFIYDHMCQRVFDSFSSLSKVKEGGELFVEYHENVCILIQLLLFTSVIIMKEIIAKSFFRTKY